MRLSSPLVPGAPMATLVDDQKAPTVRLLEESPPVDEDMITVRETKGTSFRVCKRDLLIRVGLGKTTPHDFSIAIEYPSRDKDGNKGNARLRQKVVLMLGVGRVRNGPPVGHTIRDIVFILDSGAAVHVTGNHALFCALTAEPQGRTVRTANGHTLPIIGSGSIIFEGFRLNRVLYVPGLTRNLVSVSKLTELDYVVEFLGGHCLVRDTRPNAAGAVVGRGRRMNGIYELDYLEIPLDRAPMA